MLGPNPQLADSSLLKNYESALVPGSATVPVAVFGVSPNTLWLVDAAPLGETSSGTTEDGRAPQNTSRTALRKLFNSPLAPQKLRHGFGAGADLEFLVDPPDVGVHRFVADPQLLGDFLVQKPFA